MGILVQELSHLDIAQLKFEMRQLYAHIGLEGALQVLYEIMISARIMAEVIEEERNKNAN